MKLVAEIGSNHLGSLQRALEHVKTAGRAGFSRVKTQAWRLERLFAPEALAASPTLRARKTFEVPLEWHPILRKKAHEYGMTYGITPCSVQDLEEVEQHADWLKVGSYSLLDHRLFSRLACQQKPIVISTGMATTEEIAAALYGNFLWLPRPTLLHCVSAYPAPPHEANLRSLPHLRKEFGCEVGWSDHTLSPLVLARAEKVFEASMLEVHWDLDDRLGAEAGHSWTPETWALRACPFTDDGFYQCDGKRGVKVPSVSESSERDWRADPSDGLRPMKAIRAKL